jgi:hypothetical protein
MAKIAYTKSLMDTKITILALQKKEKKLMDSVNVQIHKIDIGKLLFVEKNIDFDRNIKKIILVINFFKVDRFFTSLKLIYNNHLTINS